MASITFSQVAAVALGTYTVKRGNVMEGIPDRREADQTESSSDADSWSQSAAIAAWEQKKCERESTPNGPESKKAVGSSPDETKEDHLPYLGIHRKDSEKWLLKGHYPSHKNLIQEAAHRGIPLAGADLRAVDLSDLDLSGVDLKFADIRGANLSRCNLSGADLQGALLTGGNLERADLTGAKLAGSIGGPAELAKVKASRALFFKTHMDGVVFNEADLSNAIIEKTQANRCDFIKANFRGASLRESSFNQTDFREANLDGTTMEKSWFRQCDFTDAKMVRCTEDDIRLRRKYLETCSFEGSVGWKIEPRTSKLSWLQSSSPDACKVDRSAHYLERESFFPVPNSERP